LKSGIKKILLVTALALVAAGSGAGLEKYRQWQQRRLVASAQAFFRQHDNRSAWLAAQQAFNKDPQSAESCKILAAIADGENSPAAILWMQKLVEIEPHNDSHWIRLALTASRFNEPEIATHALGSVSATGRATSAFHQAAAALALAAQQYREAGEHFKSAIALEPQNDSLKISLASLDLVTGDAATAGDARKRLEEFGKNSPLHQVALRALLADARRQNDTARSMRFATELRSDPTANVEDRLPCLEELLREKNPAFDSELLALQNTAGAQPGAVAAVMVWMNAHGFAAKTIAWGGALPASVASQMPVPLALAEAYTAQCDWENLRKLVAKADWGALEFLRLAINARASMENSGAVRDSDFDLKWSRAVIATHGNPNAAIMLARLVGGWGWNKEAAQVWWILASQKTGRRFALESLYRIYSDEKNASELCRVAREFYQLEPENPVAKNNLASLDMLLGRDLPEAQRLADENFRQLPNDPVILSTQAFSLYLQKRTKEAVELMATLPQSALEDPSIAAAYGVMLAANGDREKAQPFLDLAMKNKGKLFKEEAALVAAALDGTAK
jgi:predicted Zn-dependent protease